MTESQQTSTTGEATQLGKGLQVRHLTMMGLGSAIGAGLFLGTGVGIKAAGPGVLISYVIAGIIVVLVMQMLGEMSAARPASGSFSTYAEMAFGSSAGFVLGWLYWFMLIMVLGAEITGAGAIMGAWFGVPGWIPGLICVVFFAVVNLANVRGFGEFEFWFAFIKVAVIIAFLVIGLLIFLGLIPGTTFVGSTHIAQSGFLPNGTSGIAAGLLAVAFAFGGIEIVTIAAAEADDPRRSIAAAVRSVIFRISVFYLGCVMVIILLLPYSQIDGADSAAQSPFTLVLQQANIPGVVGFMEAIIVLALLSAFNAQIYASSRLVYSMSTRGEAPRFFALTNSSAVPNRAVIMSMVFAFISVGLQVIFDGSSVLIFLLNAVGGCLLVIWLVIALSEIKLRPQMEANGELSVRMWGYPVLSWVAVVLILGLGVVMLTDESARQQVIAVLCVTAFLAIVAALTKKGRAAARESVSTTDGEV
ncbi:amino acid permease [Corynebacterium lactis]|uniref:Amino acid transporter n=1 Tax=Corynebacterium lactis RW2-5 TaxID=1408189 RepID=A0A0K2GZ26_9CORY|nr:amino acid permease [Corynebacterium lactis]ALA67039.1 amino acid transporter [Corynebacterium lactis RW2-5]